MKRSVALVALISGMVLALSGCGKKEEDMKYLKDFDATKYVTLGEYKGISVDSTKNEVTDEQVKQYIDYILSYYEKPVEITDRTNVQDGDIVNIDYVGKKDGVEFEGGSAEGYDLEIGSGTFIDGFESGLVGANKGDTLDLNLTFPEDYGNADLAGQEVVFTVTVNKIQESTIPEFNDEFVKGLGDENITNVADFKEYIKSDLEESAESERVNAINNQIDQAVLASCSVNKIPSGFLDRVYNTMIDGIKDSAEQNGVDAGTIAAYYYQVSADNYEAELKTYVEENIVPEYMIMGAIAQKEGITVSDADIDADIQSTLDEYGAEYTLDEYKEMLGDMESYREYMLVTKVLEFLKDNAVINEK